MYAVGFLDEVTTHGSEWERAWDDTVRVLQVLTQAGYMVKLRKC